MKQCGSILWAVIPGLEKEGLVDHQCSYGKAGHSGDHYCGDGYGWSDADAAESARRRDAAKKGRTGG